MTNLISQEMADARQYMLKKDNRSDKNLVALTHDNVARVLALLYSDSSYRNSMNPQKKETMAWYIAKLLNEIANDKIKTKTIYSVVKTIDKDNRTHLNADKCGIDEITERLSELTIEDWKIGLSGYNKIMSTGKTLVDYISEKTNPNGTTSKGKMYNGRKNLSFASKFCHFMCFFRYENEPERDNFMIWDSVLVNSLPNYLSAYGIENYDLKKYDTYMKAVYALLGKLNDRISLHGLDQLLWFYHKGA